MREVTMLKCELCGKMYEADQNHECKESDLMLHKVEEREEPVVDRIIVQKRI